ncbi:hypothetical protein [Lederbergia lenta]|uniref:hypothetical protein n=1 Tax=Lederbergia lenta TaxID=1467 RepID=UPI00203AE341|nr:hypothetical protein [Lederbergia lenta]MCM3111642.1 hypothetical protein [Lederbergia lenta]
MPQQRLYYEFVDNQLIPYWYVLTFQHQEIDWEKSIIYYDAISPFEYVERHEFDDTQVSMLIHLSDLIFNQNTQSIGISLKNVRKRIDRYGVDPYIVQQFVLSIPDLDDFLTFLPTSRKIAFVMNR